MLSAERSRSNGGSSGAVAREQITDTTWPGSHVTLYSLPHAGTSTSSSTPLRRAPFQPLAGGSTPHGPRLATAQPGACPPPQQFAERLRQLDEARPRLATLTVATGQRDSPEAVCYCFIL